MIEEPTFIPRKFLRLPCAQHGPCTVVDSLLSTALCGRYWAEEVGQWLRPCFGREWTFSVEWKVSQHSTMYMYFQLKRQRSPYVFYGTWVFWERSISYLSLISKDKSVTPTGSTCSLTQTWIQFFTTLQLQASLWYELGHSTTYPRSPPRVHTSKYASVRLKHDQKNWPRLDIDFEEWKCHDKYRCWWLAAFGSACRHSQEIRHQACPFIDQ